MKKIIALIIVMTSVFLIYGCNQVTKSQNNVAISELILTQTEDDIYFNLSNDTLQESYDALYNLFSNVDLNSLVFTTTSTANLFYELGYTPLAAPQSRSLNPDLATMQCSATLKEGGGRFDYDGCMPDGVNSVGNIGSAMAPDMETIIAINPSAVFLSDALPHGTEAYSQLINAGIVVETLPQSNVEDIFLILQVIKDIETRTEIQDNIKQILLTMHEEIGLATDLRDANFDDLPTIAIIQSSHGSNYVAGTNSVIGKLAYGLNTVNVYDDIETTELNLETLLMKDPEFIILYGHGDNRESAIAAFEALLGENDSPYRALQAVKNQNYIVLTSFSGSVTPLVSYTFLEIAEGLYARQSETE